jgi:polyphosphate glucokinase
MQALGIDVGGSGIKGAPVDLNTGNLVKERLRIKTPIPATPAAVFKTIHKLIKHFEWNGSIGCGFPAVITNNIIRTASNIDKEWIGTNISKYAKNQFPNEIYFINDADAAGLAEMKFGNGIKTSGLTILVTVGTGIGTALFYQDKLIPNTELGHLILNGLIAEHFTSDSVRKKEDLSWKKWAFRFNQYLNELDRLLWPNQIIVGGGLSKKTEKYLEYIDVKAKVLPAKLKNEAGIIGAALATGNF